VSNNFDKTALGFDFGTKSTGIAVGQQVTGTARGLGIIKTGRWQEIAQHIEKWQPDALVVGLPVDMTEKETPITKAARAFARELEARFKLPVEMMDEKLSSREARMILQSKEQRYEKKDIDALAAELILQSWLNEQSS
jgi:putative holliday junction resolvase